MIFQLQDTIVDQNPSNIFARIIPGQKYERISTAIPIIITPANVANQGDMQYLEYYAPYIFRIDPSRIYQWIL
jgi:hypothetical protein